MFAVVHASLLIVSSKKVEYGNIEQRYSTLRKYIIIIK
jgi:hypothetical protein